MKERKYNLIAFLILCLSASVPNMAIAGPKSEYTKTLQREFSTTKDGVVDLSNKYGKVMVNSWSENRVKIDVTIVVNANSEAEAEKGFDRISVNFMNTVGLVKAETVLAENEKGSWWNLVSWNNNNNSCQDFRINYVVWMPKSNDLKLMNKYGDSDIRELDGTLTANIKYGDLGAANIRNDVYLKIGYGDANLEEVEDLESFVSYGELRVRNAEDVDLNSKYSDIKIDEADRIVVKTRYDDYKFGAISELRIDAAYSDCRFKEVGKMEIDADYTDIKIEYLAKELRADMDYGEIRIGQLAKNFTSIEFDGDYSDLVLEPESGTGYSFDFKGFYADFRMNSDASFSQKEKNSGKKRYKGTVGNGNGVVKARLSYGDFVIR